MSNLLYQIQVDSIDYAKVKKAEPKLRRKAVEHALSYWKTNYLPLHFGSFASERYKYAKRKFTYLYEAKKQLRHLRYRDYKDDLFVDRKPNEKTSTLRRTLISAVPRFTEEKRGGKSAILMKLQAPKHLYYRKKRSDGSKGPDKVAELSIVLPEEFKVMQEEYKKVYTASLEEAIDKESNTLARKARASARRAQRNRAVGVSL